jgi:hypothetical protein
MARARSRRRSASSNNSPNFRGVCLRVQFYGQRNGPIVDCPNFLPWDQFHRVCFYLAKRRSISSDHAASTSGFDVGIQCLDKQTRQGCAVALGQKSRCASKPRIIADCNFRLQISPASTNQSTMGNQKSAASCCKVAVIFPALYAEVMRYVLLKRLFFRGKWLVYSREDVVCSG